MGKVDLQGESPFDLEIAQRATAHDVGGSVEISLYLMRPSHGQSALRVAVQVSAKVARELAAELSAAAVEAELRANRPGK